MRPIRLNPVYKQALWADNYISEIRKLPEEKVGIAREVCAYKGSENVIGDGEFAGSKISDIIQSHHSELMGKDDSEQLIRCAYMSSAENLSVQVHMKHTDAEKVGDYEKSESWYVLRAGEGARIMVGVNTDDKDELRRAAENNYLEKYLITQEVREGDFVLIPAGMIHANGADMLVMEVGSYGGITYRLYDYNRGRELDVDRALEVCDTSLRATFTHHPIGKLDSNRIATGVDHSLFHTDVIDVYEEMEVSTEGRYNVLSCVKQSGVVICDGEEYPLNYMQTLLIPACVSSVMIKGACRVLRSYKP